MDKSLLTSLNRRIRKYEKHLEVIIVENGLPLETVFYRVYDFQDCTILFSLKAVTGKLIKLAYSFKTGKLKHSIDDSDALIDDFSVIGI